MTIDRYSFPLLVLLALGACRHAQSPAPALSAAPAAPSDAVPPTLVEQVPGGWLALDVCADDVIRVEYAKERGGFGRSTLATAPKRCPRPQPELSADGASKTLTTAKLAIKVELASGKVTFFDREGRVLLAERGRTLSPVQAQGESAYNVRQEWEPNEGEALYGLGQHQQGLMNLAGIDLDLVQYNTEIFIPSLVSSRGYGILWDNTSLSRFGDLAPAVPLPGITGLYSEEAGAQPGDLAIRPEGDARQARFKWEGSVVPEQSGEHLFRSYSSGAFRVWVDDALVIDHYRQFWLPGEDIARASLSAGRPARVRVEWDSDGPRPIVRLLWKPPVRGRSTSLWSEVGDGVDYTFVYGPSIDGVIAGYRELTGQAPMPPRWAFGLWQCRERYRTQQESLDVALGYRRRGIPLDNIVQDWQYWKAAEWGSHEFDPARFPDPDAWIRALHEQHVRLMVSVWPKFYPGTRTFEALQQKGFVFQRNIDEQQKDFLGNVFTNYDPFHAGARELYWAQIERALFSRGVDAWWLDATEPEFLNGPFDSVAAYVDANRAHLHPTAQGSGARMLNAFSLVNSQAVYEGQRRAKPEQRVFILTRSGFAGQQRYGAASWSGDITSTWTALRKQIPAGLGFSISGIPYWTLDSGGFAVPGRFAKQDPSPEDLDEWRELNTRWFQYATFLPLLRVHGQWPNREMWEFGGDESAAFKAQLEHDRLRYRLLPYVYSLAGAVTHDAGSILRGLVMDFAEDQRARETADQYMFGPSLMVSPITEYRARERDVYLPAVAGGWYDFWTRAKVSENHARVLRAPAPFERIPVHVRAGAIVPFGPELQYTDEKPADPLTLYVYTGADGAFTLYEDDGASYGYETGAFSRIPLRWTNADRTFTIGPREGSFPQMLSQRTLEIVLVTPGRAPAAPRVVKYDGQEARVSF
jgi:alpha-D-xyloside xylohydrolase